jgi:endo-1,4-beta-D-glucanase Y
VTGAGTILAALLACILAMAPVASVAQPAKSVTAEEWELYKQKFLDPAGRIIDNANGNISHSEGQGYGLLLSYLADDRGDFDRIWAFTRTQMLLRDDGLSVWKWDPNSRPHVTDSNNATDGDLLIAYAAALAGGAWHRPDLRRTAASMAKALASKGTDRSGGVTLLKPGSRGFSAAERSDGPVVNPSYWIFETLPVMAELFPEGPWRQLDRDGRTLLAASMKIGKAGLPPDWVSLRREPAAADGFPPQFSYNAVRIPLYLLRAGIRDRTLLDPFATHMTDRDGQVRLVDIGTGATRELLSDPGYRIIPALVSCVLNEEPLPADVQTFSPTDYYPSTLHLLALSFARLRTPGCL